MARWTASSADLACQLVTRRQDHQPQVHQRPIDTADRFGVRYEGDYAEIVSSDASRAHAVAVASDALKPTAHCRATPADRLTRDVADALARHVSTGVVEVDVLETDSRMDAGLYLTGRTNGNRAGVSIRVGSIANLRTDRLGRHVELQMQLAETFGSSGVLWFDDERWIDQPTVSVRAKTREVDLPMAAVTSGTAVVAIGDSTFPVLASVIDPRDSARVSHIAQFVRGWVGNAESLPSDFLSRLDVSDSSNAEFGRAFGTVQEFLTSALTHWLVMSNAPIEPSAKAPTCTPGPIASAVGTVLLAR